MRTAAEKRSWSSSSMRWLMATAPALSPNAVTRSGSPPKEPMCSLTHLKAAIMSCKPRLAALFASASRPYGKPSMPRR